MSYHDTKRITLALGLALLLALGAGIANDALGTSSDHVPLRLVEPPDVDDPTGRNSANSTDTEAVPADPARSTSNGALGRSTEPGADDAGTNEPIAHDTQSNDSYTNTVSFTHAHATVTLDCEVLVVAVSPANVSYDLALTYVDRTTGTPIWMAVGPLNGTIVDPFGETDFRLLEVNVQMYGDPWAGVQTATVVGPDDCESVRGSSTNDST
ncbi:hypothetical protein [Halorubellus litoreus]|uniref:Secreted protein n=1 Tax=Halorubellus litoreus TaxID=755308 RepID=A0ABD5VKS5_9EURY